MKRKTFFNISAILITVSIFIAACTKEKTEVRLEPKLSTSQVTNLTSDSANVVGFIVAAGSGFTERGICYDIQTGPTTASNKVEYTGTSTNATFSVKLRGITRLTKYYARAYAINANGTVYGDEISFKTPAALSTLAAISTSTLAVTTDKGVTATTAINITDDGGPDATANITKRGVVYGLNANPTVDSAKSKLDVNKTIVTTEGTGKGSFNSLATGLKGNLKYYLRAYATNKIGTTYSNEVNFTTPVAYATAKTNSSTNITKTTATFNGVITYDGGTTISEKGFCYSLTANPTISDTKIPVVADKDSITYGATGLATNTTYHVRVFVTNSVGTNYGNDITFKTENDIPTIGYIVGTINGWNNHGQYLAARGSNVFLGYQYLDGSSKFKFFPQRDSWDNGWGAGSTAGTLVSGGGDISASDLPTYSTAGFYEIKFDLLNGTVSLALANTWGVIGDGQTGGWGTDANLTYNAGTKKWEGTVTFLATGAYKFRANDDWAINVGGVLTNLTNGGDNIATPGAGTYNVVLDLSGADSFNATVTP